LPFAGQLIPGSIGQHRIRFRPEAADLVVTTDIALKVKLAFITLLDMRHDSEERWRDGRLAALRSRTTDGDETYDVDAMMERAGLRIQSQAGEIIAPPDVGSSNAFWHVGTLEKTELVDAQNGGIVGLVARRESEETIEVAGRRLNAVRYRGITPNVAGRLWYADARLVKARFELRGETVDYRLLT
jgi:hypothetical protein